MGDLQRISYSGQPVPEAFPAVELPVPVLVDLAALFPREPQRRGGYHPGGLQMHKVVEGRLCCWGLCEQGNWWGLVTYPVSYGANSRPVTHWAPAWTLRRKG